MEAVRRHKWRSRVAEASQRYRSEVRKAQLSMDSYREGTKLTATWMTQMASGSAIAGVVTPIASLMLGSTSYGFRVTSTSVVCICLAVSLHIGARRFLKRLDP
jgi:VIT1/CCC1 family predicted Fe2+/Mn2+ transporter